MDLLGPPLGVTTGGATACTRNELVSVGPGRYEPDTGAVFLPLALRWTFFATAEPSMPCPHCSGATIGATGVCEGGPHSGESCVVDASDALFGPTSYDCPPLAVAELGSFDFVMELTTGTSRLEPAAACTSKPFAGLACFCPDQTIANFCDDGNCLAGPDGDFTCATGPLDGFCEQEPFRGCLSDTDCPAAGDACGMKMRECPAAATSEAGAVSPVVLVGVEDPVRPLLVGTFCVPAAIDASANQGLGLPGPAALRLPVRLEPSS
jgi:hypothetical protein